jgi:hypothetical protein
MLHYIDIDLQAIGEGLANDWTNEKIDVLEREARLGCRRVGPPGFARCHAVVSGGVIPRLFFFFFLFVWMM